MKFPTSGLPYCLLIWELSWQFRRELLLPPWCSCLSGLEDEELEWLQDGLGFTSITLPKDHKADSTLESEMSPDCTICWLETPFESESKGPCHIPVTWFTNTLEKVKGRPQEASLQATWRTHQGHPHMWWEHSAQSSIISRSLILWPSWDWIRRKPTSTNEPLREKMANPKSALYPANTLCMTEKSDVLFISLNPHNRIFKVSVYDPSFTDEETDSNRLWQIPSVAHPATLHLSSFFLIEPWFYLSILSYLRGRHFRGPITSLAGRRRKLWFIGANHNDPLSPLCQWLV